MLLIIDTAMAKFFCCTFCPGGSEIRFWNTCSSNSYCTIGRTCTTEREFSFLSQISSASVSVSTNGEWDIS